jgi:hypothetical protein
VEAHVDAVEARYEVVEARYEMVEARYEVAAAVTRNTLLALHQNCRLQCW